MRCRPPCTLSFRHTHPRHPKRDAALTRRFHHMLSRLKPPPRPVDGVKWNPFTHPLDWPGWPIVRVDIRMLK